MKIAQAKDSFKQQKKLKQTGRFSLLLCLLLSIALNVLANGHILEQKYTLNLSFKNARIEQVLDAISKQSGIRIAYSNEILPADLKVSVDMRTSSIAEALNAVLGEEYSFKQIDNYIAIAKKAIEKKATATVVAQQKSIQIKGRITDAKGEAIIGANVIVKGTTNGTMTDIDGNYTLKASEGEIIQITYIGYNKVEVKVGKNDILNAVLEEDSKALEEVVVVAYGTQKKSNLTAAVETVSRKVLENRPVKSATQMLEGVVPNLNISVSSGAPDGKVDLNIRGFTGLEEKAAPLVLVDGVEQSLDMVNPNDIETISVLKDAAASAIYGSRAPFGVILITTKSGEAGQKVAINYSGSYQLNQPSMLPHTVNSVDFANTMNNSYRNSLAAPYFSDDVMQRMRDYMAGTLLETNQKTPAGTWGGQTVANGNTDFFDHAFKKVSQNTTHDINISGGTAKTSYYAGIGYHFQEGIYNTDLDTYNRYNAMLKLNTEVTNWLSFRFNARYVNQGTKRPNYSGSSKSNESDDNFWTKLSYFPNIPIRNPDGEYHVLSAMPMLEGKGGYINNSVNDLWLTGGLEIKPCAGLTINGNFSWNTQNGIDERTTYRVFIMDGGRPVLSKRSADIDGIWKNNTASNYFTMDLTANYTKKFGKHDLSALIGMQVEQKNIHNTQGGKTGLYSTGTPSFSTSWGDNITLSDSKIDWATMGYFFRLSYNYDGRYLLDVNGRYDAASKYSPETRWAFFPSVSAGWNIAKEAFWPLEEISTLKVTGSFGMLGDQSSRNYYMYIPVMATQPSTDHILAGQRPPYIEMPAMISPDLTWAKPQSIGIGAELAALNNRLRGEYYWYQRTVYDQLGPADKFPEVLGTTPPQANNAVSETRGWEASVSWRDQACTIANSPLNYSVRLILSDYIGYVVKYSGNVSGATNAWTVGQEFSSLYGLEALGIAGSRDDLHQYVLRSLPKNAWHYTGDMLYQDLNGDGRIDSGMEGSWSSLGDQKKLGYRYPRYKYAINLGLEWKNFDLSIFLDGVGKEVAYVNNYWSFGQTGAVAQRTMLDFQQELGYWSENNRDAFFPRIYNDDKNFKEVNDKYLIDLSHLRIKNLSLGYSVPSAAIQKIGLSRLAFNFSIENLGMIYYNSWLKLDPQMVRNGCKGYPIQRTYSLGVKIGI